MTTFTARTPADLLALVPVVIGFHPEDSVVLLTFGTDQSPGRGSQARAETFQARVDLPVMEHEQRTVATMLRDVVSRHQITRAAVLFYSEDCEVARSFADLLLPGLLADEVEIVDVLRVDGERFFCVAEPDDEGVAYDVSSHPLTAAGVLHGRVVHDSRSALRDTLVGPDSEDLQEVTDAADAFMEALIGNGFSSSSAHEVLAEQGRWLQRTLARHLEAPDRLSADHAGRLAVLLSFDPLREVAWSEFTRANAVSYVEFLRAFIRRTPWDLVPGVGSLLGLAAWLSGDGALAWCALDRCLAAAPDDRLGHHVAALLESATPPSVWAPLSARGLPIFADGRPSGSCSVSDLGSGHGQGRGGAGVQPG